MSDTPETAYETTPCEVLREQIMDSRIPKNEREWWAAREIERLQRERDEAREVAAHWKTEYEIVVDRLRGRKHPRDNGIITDDEIVPTLTRERDEARSQRNALAASLEYIASAGLTARQCEDEATKMLALVFEKEDGE